MSKMSEWFENRIIFIIIAVISYFIVRTKAPPLTLNSATFVVILMGITYFSGFIGWQDILRNWAMRFQCSNHSDSIGIGSILPVGTFFCIMLGGWKDIWAVAGGGKGHGCIFVPKCSVREWTSGLVAFTRSEIMELGELPLEFQSVIRENKIKPPYRMAISPVEVSEKYQDIMPLLKNQAQHVTKLNELLKGDFTSTSAALNLGSAALRQFQPKTVKDHIKDYLARKVEKEEEDK